LAQARVLDIESFRERVELTRRRVARRFEIRTEALRLRERSRRNIFELLTEAEAARLLEVAPTLMGVRKQL
jgi:DNA-binding transcriptional regulator YiaG